MISNNFKSESHKKIELRFSKFKKENYDEYNSWFENKEIKNALYDIDGEWLNFILKDKTGIVYAVFKENEIVSVVGIIYPTKKHPTFGIKSIPEIQLNLVWELAQKFWSN